MDGMKQSLTIFSTALMFLVTAHVLGADGKAIYAANCVKCHGNDGKGQTKMGKKLQVRDFTQPDVWNTFDDDDAFNAVKNGIKKDGEVVMGYKFPDADIKAVIEYMKTMKVVPAPAAPAPAAPAPADTNTAAPSAPTNPAAP